MIGCNWAMVDITDEFFPPPYNFESGQNDKIIEGNMCKDD
jgi:hypothetical protein